MQKTCICRKYCTDNRLYSVVVNTELTLSKLTSNTKIDFMLGRNVEEEYSIALTNYIPLLPFFLFRVPSRERWLSPIIIQVSN